MYLWRFLSQKEYLKEPTAEFKAMEARQSEFASAQRAYKQDFVKKLDAFLAVETDEDAVSTLNAISSTVIKRGGLPESVRINDLLKTCRRKKAAMKDSGKWGTPVQIAYEASELGHLSANVDKNVLPWWFQYCLFSSLCNLFVLSMHRTPTAVRARRTR